MEVRTLCAGVLDRVGSSRRELLREHRWSPGVIDRSCATEYPRLNRWVFRARLSSQASLH